MQQPLRQDRLHPESLEHIPEVGQTPVRPGVVDHTPTENGNHVQPLALGPITHPPQPPSDGRGTHASLVDDGFRCFVDVPSLTAFGR